ncbi:MAG: hypothetical protein ACREFQ_16840, partial [Stellaceae bacterium]
MDLVNPRSLALGYLKLSITRTMAGPISTTNSVGRMKTIASTNGVSNDTYHFNVGSVGSNSVTYIDPLVATGFIYT